MSYAHMHHEAKDMVCYFTLPEKSYWMDLKCTWGLKPPQRCDVWSDDSSKFGFSSYT